MTLLECELVEVLKALVNGIDAGRIVGQRAIAGEDVTADLAALQERAVRDMDRARAAIRKAESA
jgi:hypothetical protein